MEPMRRSSLDEPMLRPRAVTREMASALEQSAHKLELERQNSGSPTSMEPPAPAIESSPLYDSSPKVAAQSYPTYRDSASSFAPLGPPARASDGSDGGHLHRDSVPMLYKEEEEEQQSHCRHCCTCM